MALLDTIWDLEGETSASHPMTWPNGTRAWRQGSSVVVAWPNGKRSTYASGAAAVAAIEPRLANAVKAETTDHRERGRARGRKSTGYCRICRGPHVHKHGRR